MTEREELLRRLERVKALAERGVGGEKENAEALLNRLMAKYGISEEDIEDTAERDYFIRYHNFWERKLIVQIAYKLPTSILAAVTAAVRSAPTRDGRTRRYV